MRPVTKREIVAHLERIGLEPSKALGQNFLTDGNIARKEAALAAEAGLRVAVEVGPGLGSLTVWLAEYFDEVVALEADRRLIPALGEVLAARGIDNVRIEHADALADPLPLERRPSALVANLPYHSGSQILVRLVEEAWFLERVVVMVQAEFADRIVAAAGTRACSALGVRLALSIDAHVAAKVPPVVFHPQPTVWSKLVVADRRSEPLAVTEPTTFDATVRAIRHGFERRRQMLRRALGDDELAALEVVGIDPMRRAESLELDEWVALGRAIATWKGAR